MSTEIDRFVLDEVTPYGVARAGGYTGTKAQYETMLAGLPTAAANAASSAQDAAGAKDAAIDAKSDAETAQASAESSASVAAQSAAIAQNAAANAQLAAIAAKHGLNENADTWLADFVAKICRDVIRKLDKAEGEKY